MYEVFDAQGERVMHGTLDVRYAPHIERSLYDAGYKIRIDGRLIKPPKRGAP